MSFRLLFFFFIFRFAIADAYGAEITMASRISETFIFDGKLTAGEWDHVPEIEFIVQTPVYHSDPSQKSIIKLAYDQNYIYLSGALYDTHPERIVGNTKLRDGGDESTDWFGMIIDSYNDKQNALAFFTTPTGIRFDAAIQNDANASSGNPMNLSWNNFWDVKTVFNDEGWFAEMRIPFSSLQFQEKDGAVTMGIIIWRYIARLNEMHISPDISPDMGEMGSFRPSLSKEYQFTGVSSKKPFYITPYVLGGFNHQKELNENGNGYLGKNNLVRSAGLDVKYGITNNFTLDLSVNTDFAQVEVDDQQINLTRFSLFFPEKRLFFQERSGIFNFGLGSSNNLFYSRRIGIDSEGNAIPILGGARITGRSNNLDVGILSMQTRGTDELISNNYSVLRLKRRVFNEFSDAGFLLTNSIAADGTFNTVYGFDSNIRVFKDDFLSIKLAQSISDNKETNLASVDPSAIWISLSRRSEDGFTYGTSYSRLGNDFNSSMGFIERADYTRYGTRLQYFWYPGEHSRLFRHGPSARGVSFWDNSDNAYNSGSYRISYMWAWKNGIKVDVGTRILFDEIKEDFDLAGVVTIPAEGYLYQNVNMEFSTPSVKPYRLVGEIETGTFFDGYKNSLLLSPAYNVSSSLTLTGTYEYNNVSFDARGEQFTAHIARIKALVMFNTKLSISSFIQYNSLNHLYLGNIRLRYNPKEGNDLFIVYNSDLNAERSFYYPTLPVTNQSSLLIKYSYTFTL